MKDKKWAYVALGMVGLLAVYLFQKQINMFASSIFDGFSAFAFGRGIRFILNDIFVIIMIYGLFPRREYVIFALLVQVAGILFILFPYLILKYSMPGYNGPLISFLHRLVLNPLLMLMLIPAFYLKENN